jgi:hypothetical protein
LNRHLINPTPTLTLPLRGRVNWRRGLALGFFCERGGRFEFSGWEWEEGKIYDSLIHDILNISF